MVFAPTSMIAEQQQATLKDCLTTDLKVPYPSSYYTVYCNGLMSVPAKTMGQMAFPTGSIVKHGDALIFLPPNPVVGYMANDNMCINGTTVHQIDLRNLQLLPRTFQLSTKDVIFPTTINHGGNTTLTSVQSTNQKSDNLNDDSTRSRSDSVSTTSSRDSSQSDSSILENERKQDADDKAIIRGRPRTDKLDYLRRLGANSKSAIRCNICQRIFPREKSLQAHKRTHTGERPYACDFPNCGKTFAQSGQLKTHLRIHTGEKPFLCSQPGCTSRFTHSNRRCSDHPNATLKRNDSAASITLQADDPQVMQWLTKLRQSRQDRHVKRLQKQTPLSPIKVDNANIQKNTNNQVNADSKHIARLEAKKRLADHRAKWNGAMALVKLSENME